MVGLGQDERMAGLSAAVRSGGRMVFAAAITGVLAGLGGLVLTLLLRAVQHAAFGYTEDTFLIGVQQAPGGRRVLAMATGGSCAFFVDGTPKGTTSKLNLQVKAGSHTVMCRPAAGAAKSRSVAVDGGGTALAVFKL
jgi:hypothetical protein